MPDSDSNDITRSYVQLVTDSIIGYYRIVEKIGAGGMGEAYLAEDSGLGRKIALKLLLSPSFFNTGSVWTLQVGGRFRH